MLRDIGLGLVVAGCVVGGIGLAGTIASDAQPVAVSLGALLAAAGCAAMIEHVRLTIGPGRARRAARFVRLVARRGVEGVVCDVDGTLTDGRIHRGESGVAGRSFHSHDGIGTHLLRERGLAIGWLSGTADGASIDGRASMVGVEHIDWGRGDKGDRFTSLCEKMGVPPQRVVYIGDDLNDLPAMRRAGLSACPADAPAAVRHEASVVVGVDGGHGAFRALAELILEGLGDRDDASPG